MTKNQKLELTWIGKENRPRLEPRILLENPAKPYLAKHRVIENDIFDNRLIFEDNLLALKALEAEFAGKVKCVFIDPPYNTGSAFTHYDDGLEHSIWLSLMQDRLEIIRRLLSEDGSLWITIDDNEAHYLKVLCDEIFGRVNFVAIQRLDGRISMEKQPNDTSSGAPRLFDRVRNILESARAGVARTVNTAQVMANWLIGREIVEEEQRGKRRADYGQQLVAQLSERLTAAYGKG